MRFRAVFFDFDETLVHADPPVFDTFLPACRRAGLSFDEGQVRNAHRFLFEFFSGENARQAYAALDQNLDRFHTHVTEQTLVAMGVDATRAAEAVAQAGLSVRLPQGLACTPGAHALLEGLKRRGAVLGVISNNGGDIVERSRAFGFDEYLDFVITRVDAGCSKPAPEIFAAALARAGVDAGATAHVGDNYFADVVGARAAGITPVLVDPHGVFPDADCHTVARVAELLDWFA